MNPHNQQLFVLIVHFGEPAVTYRASQSLLAGRVQPTKVIIIDHGTSPLTLSPDPRVHIVRPSSGGGYAAGINFGLGLLMHHGGKNGDIVIAMNNDVEVYPDTLQQLRTWWATTATPGLVGGSIEERGVVVAGGGRINYWTGRATLITDYGLRITDYAPDYIHGAFIAAPYEVWLKLQGLPGQYHLYWEDVLLGRRAKKMKISMHHAPLVRLKHHTDSAVSSQQQYYLIRNGALFMQYELPAPGRWWWFLYNRLRYLYHAFHPEPSHRVVAQALKDALMGKTENVKI